MTGDPSIWIAISSISISLAAVFAPMISRRRTEAMNILEKRIDDLHDQYEDCERRSKRLEENLHEARDEIEWLRRRLMRLDNDPALWSPRPPSHGDE